MAIDWAKLDAGLDALSADKTEEPKQSEGRAFTFPEIAPKEKSETTGIELPYQDVEDVGTAFDEPKPLLPRENESIRAKVSNAIDEFSFGDMFDALGNARDKNVLADALEENAEAAGAYVEGEENAPEAAAYEAAEQEAEEARAAALVSPFRQAARSFIKENADDSESRWQEAAQGLRRSSANLAYFMTPEEKLAKAREVSEFTGIPANRILESDDAYRSALSVYDYAKKKQAIADAEGDDFTIEDIYSEFPGLDKIVKNDPQGAALALADIHNLREIRDGVTGAKKGWARGAKTLEANLLSWKDMKGEATDEDRKKLAELQKELAEDEFILPSVFVDPVTAIIGASSESLPLMLYSFAEAGKEGVRDAAIYATAAMAVGAATGAAPGAVAGAVGGGATGFAKGLGTAFFRALMQGGGQRALKWGTTAGMYGANARAMMGEKFEEYQKIPGVSRDEARTRAFIAGGVEAGIETWSDLLFAKLSMRPYTKNVIREIIGTAKDSMRPTGSNAASAIGEYAADAAKETLGEMTEEALQSLSGDLMMNDIKASHHLGGELSGQEIALNAFQAGLEAAPASFGLTMGGSVLGAPGRAWNYRASRAQAARWNRLTEKQRETFAGTLMLDRLQGEVEASKLKDAAPDVQQQLIREELKDTPWQMAYVDTGLVLAQEGGREDVEALGEAAGLSKEEIAQTIAEEGTLTIPTEIYAQTKTSPAALSATTFSEDAEPMAKMKERAAQYAEEIQRETHAAVNKQIDLIEGVADMLFPGEKELRDEALDAIYEDPENPAQGWKSLMKRLTEAQDEILAPAMKALDEGMGQGTSVVETVDKNGDVKTGRGSNNAEWYRRFYAENGRKPKKQEMIDLARDLTFALPGAPEVEGWRATTDEDEAAMRQGYEEYQKIEKEIEQLNAIKERMGTLTKGELDVIQGMSKEGYEVYRNLQSDLLQLGGDAAKAAKMNALLFARHAEVAAKAMQRLGHKNYTAMDYYRDNLSVVGEDVEAPKRGAMEQFAGENAENADQMKLAEAERMEESSATPEDIFEATGWLKGEDGKWRFEIPDNLDKINLDLLRINEHMRLEDLYENEALFEAYPFLRNVMVSEEDMQEGSVGRLDVENEIIFLNANMLAEGDQKLKNSIVHEIQHLIQKHEGFAMGGNPADVRGQILSEIRRIKGEVSQNQEAQEKYASYQGKTLQALNDPTPETWAEMRIAAEEFEKVIAPENKKRFERLVSRMNSLQKAYDSQHDNFFLYARLGGEQEARKAADRAEDWTKAYRGVEEANRALNEGMDKATKEQRAALVERMKLSFEIEGMPTEQQIALMEKYEAKMGEELSALYDDYMWERGTLEEFAKDMPHPHNKAIIVFGGEEMPYSENNQGGFSDGQIFEQAAWHGSPHIFQSFDLGAIGTGEGAQAHGWGLYFAQNRMVAEGYKERLSQQDIDVVTIDGKTYQHKYINDEPVWTDEEGHEIWDDAAQFADWFYANEYDLEKTKKALNEYKNGATSETAKAYADKMLSYANSHTVEHISNTGSLFQVEIPDDDVLLDEDKTLDEQPEKVKAAIREYYRSRPDSYISDDTDFNLGGSSGRDFYKDVVFQMRKEGSKTPERDASELLNQYGIEGITYEGGRDGRCFVVFDDKAISVIETYNQAVNGGKVTRGRIWRDRRQGKKIIQLLSMADRSTFLHEIGHLFLMDLEDLAAMGDEESQRMLDEVDDWAKWQGKGDAKKYVGTEWAEEFADREAAILEADRAGDLLGRDALMARWRQERFARAWEIYLMEGTAPSKGLRAVFRKFKSWLRKIYDIFISDGARASKDVEKVMARLVASEEEIERMEADARYTDFAAAGGEKLLKEDAKETFARWQEEAREEAKTRIRREIMKDLKGKRADDWAEEMAAARVRIEEELRNEPIYLARRAIEESGDPAMWKIFFDTKEAFDQADKAPSISYAVEAQMDEYEREADKSRLDAEITDKDVEEALSSAHWHERLIELETQAFAKKLALTQTFGEKQQNAVERLETAISAMEDTDTLQGEETEQERFKAAQRAVTSLKVSGRWSKELFGIIQRMEQAQTKADFAEGLKAFREAKKEQEKLSKKDFDTANEGEVEDTRRRAKEALANMKLSEAMMHATFRQHEREAASRAEKMVKAKRWDVAMICKRQQLYASMCAAEGRKIAERAQKLRDRVKKQIESKVQLPKDEGYWLAHLAYVLRIVDNDVEKPEGLQSLAAIGKQMTDGLDVLGDEDGHNELTALLLKYTDTESKEGWRGMTIGELEDAVEALNMLYTIGRDKFKLKTMQGKHIEDVRAEILSDPTSYNGARVKDYRVTGNDNTGGLLWNDWIAKIPMVGGKLAKEMQRYGESLTKTEEMIRPLGEKAQRYLYGTYDRAMAEECKETARVMEKLNGIIGAYSRAERQTWQDRKYTFMGEKLSKENILAMALHLGTDSNRQRLAQGMFSMDAISDMRKQAREDIGKGADWMDVAFPVIMGFLEENMTEKDWAFVQGVWDIFKEQWPKTVETEMKLNGRRLKPLELRPFTANVKDEEGNTKEIQLRGGYCPVRYDPEKSAKAGEQAENDLAKQQMSGAMVFGMNRYFTKERVEQVFDRPLLLSLSVIPSHLMAAIHNSTYRLAARDVYRLLNDGEIRRRIESTMGMDAYRVMKKWATDNWALAPGTDNIAERWITRSLAYTRRNAGIAIMGFRLWPAVENATNIFPMMDRLGVAGTMTALSDFYGNMREGRELMKKSVYMVQRAEHMDRDFRQQRDMFEAKGAVAEWLTEHAYSLMELTDLAGSAPLWVHTYKEVFGAKYKEVEEENKKNIQALETAKAERDKIAASYHDKRMAEQDIEAELENRKYLRMPEPGNPLGGIKTSQLREELAILKREMQEMKRDLAKANGELDRAAGLLFLTNDEIVSEAERRSVAAADEAVRDVFGSGDVKDLAEIQKGGELSKMMTAFYSYFNAQANAVLRSHWKGKWKERNLTPLARTIFFRFILTSMLATAGKMLLTGEGNDDKDKYRKRADGTREEIPLVERALKAYGKNLLSTAVGGMYGVRDVAAAAINLMFDGTDYGRGISMGGVGTRIFEQTWQEVKLIRAKAERDEKERIAEEKRQAKYDKMTRKQKTAFDERQKYRKPPATISYADILRGAGSIGTSLTAARTGITEPIANAVLGTMQYLTDSDGRYEATLKNMIWSALWTKKPVKRTPPEKPEKTETPRERRRRERKERREARRGT